MSVKEVITKYFTKVHEAVEICPKPTNEPSEEVVQEYFGDKLAKLADPNNYVQTNEPEFDIEPLADEIYNTFIDAGFIVKRSIVYGLLTFVIVDERYETYLDVTYGTKGVKDYILNVMEYRKVGDRKISELATSKKATNLNEVYSILNLNKNKQLLK